MQYAILLECDPGNTLGGSCIRDVKNMAENLVSRCSFNPQNIHILTTNSTFQKSMSNKYSSYPANSLFNVIDNIKSTREAHTTRGSTPNTIFLNTLSIYYQKLLEMFQKLYHTMTKLVLF